MEESKLDYKPEFHSIMYPTQKLRWVESHYERGIGNIDPILQQLWVCTLTGKEEWRDIEVVPYIKIRE